MYSWNRYLSVETVTYNWNTYSVNYSNTQGQMNENGMTLYGANIQDYDSDAIRYFPTKISETYEKGKGWKIESETRTTFREFFEDALSSRNTSGYILYENGRITSSVKTEDGYTFNFFFTISSYIRTYETSCVGQYETNFKKFVYNGNSIPYTYGGYIALGTCYSFLQSSSPGAQIGSISSQNSSAYPANGLSGGIWYVSAGNSVSYSQGEYVDTVENVNPSEYPENGRHTDGYWYVKL